MIIMSCLQKHIKTVGHITLHVFFTSGEDSRVHESGHAEVCEGEEEDNSNVDGNDRGEIL